jgi:hypothetical protein
VTDSNDLQGGASPAVLSLEIHFSAIGVYQALHGNQQATLVEFQDSELLTDETMSNHRLLIIPLFLGILPFNGAAQDAPDPKQAELEMSVHVWSMTGVELEELISKAQSGDAQAQYWVGIKCEEGQLESMDPQESTDMVLEICATGFRACTAKVRQAGGGQQSS